MEKYQGRPFVLLGVNGDPEREHALNCAARHRLPFRSFWYAGGPGNPIVRQYGVQFWPTVIVIDGRGVIRYGGPPDPNAITRIIDQALAEIENRKV